MREAREEGRWKRDNVYPHGAEIDHGGHCFSSGGETVPAPQERVGGRGGGVSFICEFL